MLADETEVVNHEWAPAVAQMHEQAGRIKEIINDMMMLSRLEDLEAENEHNLVVMVPLIERAVSNVQALAAQKEQSISLDLDENYSLECHSEEVETLLVNLLSNAIRYSQMGGKICVKWQVDVSAAKLSVIDTGIGIAEVDMPRLTERFYRVDKARSRAHGGTGLGLAIVNHIVSRHQATIHIKSKVGEGSTFTVRFPHSRLNANHEKVKLLLN